MLSKFFFWAALCVASAAEGCGCGATPPSRHDTVSVQASAGPLNPEPCQARTCTVRSRAPCRAAGRCPRPRAPGRGAARTGTWAQAGDTHKGLHPCPQPYSAQPRAPGYGAARTGTWAQIGDTCQDQNIPSTPFCLNCMAAQSSMVLDAKQGLEGPCMPCPLR